MPNHIKNRLSFIGDESRIKELIDRFSTFHPETQHLAYDGSKTYEKVGEKLSFGWLHSDGSFTVRGARGENIVHPQILEGYVPHMERAFTRFPDFEKVISPPDDPAYRDEPSQQVAQSSPNWWHTWNCANWGTKWNSYDCEKINTVIYEFDTAWSNVQKVIREIAKAFPDVKIGYEWSDEDTGCNVGTIVFHEGLETHTIYPNCSRQAYELAFKLRPDCAERYILVNGKYEYKEEEETESKQFKNMTNQVMKEYAEARKDAAVLEKYPTVEAYAINHRGLVKDTSEGTRYGVWE